MQAKTLKFRPMPFTGFNLTRQPAIVPAEFAAFNPDIKSARESSGSIERGEPG